MVLHIRSWCRSPHPNAIDSNCIALNKNVIIAIFFIMVAAALADGSTWRIQAGSIAQFKFVTVYQTG